MLISIIIPIYNVEEYIAECLESVYQQTYPSIEVIIVNDCTPDKSMETVQFITNKNKDRYPTTIITHEHNQGLSEARNSGMQVAKGDYIYFIDSDDVMTPNAIELLADVVIKNEGIEIVEGKHHTGKKVKPTIHSIPKQSTIYKGYDSKRQYLIGDINLYAWNTLYKRDFLLTHSLYFQSKMLYEDILFRINTAQHLSSMGVLPAITYFYRYNHSSLSHKASIRNLLSIKEILNQHINILKQRTPPQDIYLSCFCKNAFLYWNKPCRMIKEHKEHLGDIQNIVNHVVSRYYKQMRWIDWCLLSPFFLPYRLAKHHVKIIWSIWT